MIKRHISASVIILIAGIFMWNCQSPAGPDNKPSASEAILPVTVYSEPWHADIWINGADTFKRTHNYVYLSLGTHELMLLKPGYKVWKTNFRLTEEHYPHGHVIKAELEGIRIKMEHPASNTIWIKGEEALIAWDPQYIHPIKESDDNGIVTVEHGTPYLPSVTIYLYKGGDEIMTIVSILENTGSYSWTVDPSLQEGTDYRVRVLSSHETPRISEHYGESETFTIN